MLEWNRNFLLLAICLGLAGTVSAQDKTQAAADLVLLNGVIYTVDASRSTAQAAAIRDGKFTAVGTDAEVKRLIGSKTKVTFSGYWRRPSSSRQATAAHRLPTGGSALMKAASPW